MNSGGDLVKTLIERIVHAMVDNPEQVKVDEIVGGNTTVYEVRAAKSDLGKVIGKRGSHANAIRTILTAASATAQKGRAILEIVE
jgi:predicted RNA-binding protein YlqC (UPF0109 family)